jgi:Myb/SANT-like DNA-binding domain
MPPKNNRKTSKAEKDTEPHVKSNSKSKKSAQDNTESDTEPKEVEVKSKVEPRLVWTAEMHEGLIEGCYSAFKGGKGTDGSGFKKESWPGIIASVQAQCRGKVPVQEHHCRNKWTWYKDHWKTWVILSGTSGMGWNEEKELYEGDDYLWDTLNSVCLSS